MIASRITITRSITPAGKDVLSVKFTEGATLVEVLGLLEIAKGEAIASFEESDDDDS